MKMYGMAGMDLGATEETLVLNANHPLVKYVLEHRDSEYVAMICRQLYDLAKISHAPLEADEMAEFIARSNEVMMVLTK